VDDWNAIHNHYGFAIAAITCAEESDTGNKRAPTSARPVGASALQGNSAINRKQAQERAC